MAKQKITIANQDTLLSVSEKVGDIAVEIDTLKESMTGGESASIQQLCYSIINTVSRIADYTDNLETDNDELIATLTEVKDIANGLTSTLEQSNITELKTDLNIIKSTTDNLALNANKNDSVFENISNRVNQLTTDRMSIIDSIGFTDDDGGSPVSGTLMSKANRCIGELQSIAGSYTNVRAGYLDAIYENTNKLKAVDFEAVPSVKRIVRGVRKASAMNVVYKATDLSMGVTGNTTPYYFDINLDTNIVNVNKTVVRVKSFAQDGISVRELPTEFIGTTEQGLSSTVRVYTRISDSSEEELSDIFGYFWEVIEYN